MTARDTLEYLSNIGMSPHYMKPITLFKNLQPLADWKIEYEPISNPLDILPPSVWLTIDHNECLSKIKNDVEKSRVTREGYLITNVAGNCLNQINYQSFDEDIAVIQENEHCLCVPFSVVKDNCQEILKYIHKELRIFHESSLVNKVKRTYNNKQYLDDISQFVYSKFRTFIIFEAKMQSARVPILQSCYYPSVNFTIEKIKTKEVPKFSPNETLTQIKEGGLRNTFGYLSLDSKKRLLLVKRDEPDLDLQRECFIGVWVSSFLPLKRTEKKFGKEDSIWCAIFQFYTNKELRNRIKLTEKNKSFLIYFPPSTPNKPKRLPEFYLFEPDYKMNSPKWCFMLKQETLTDWKKNLELKFDFLNNTIIEEREYSEFSDATNSEERILVMQKADLGHSIVSPKDALSDFYLSNQKGTEGNKKSSLTNSSVEEKEKSTIEQLQRQLEYYKKRCMELETMNNLLVTQQQHLMVRQHHQYAFSTPPQFYPQFQQYGQHPYAVGFPPAYPLSHSQAGNLPMPQPFQPYTEQADLIRGKGEQKLPISATEKLEQEAANGEEEKIGSSSNGFMKKRSAEAETSQSKKDVETLRVNSSAIREIFVKPDARNISFQDSFAENQEGELSDEERYYEDAEEGFGDYGEDFAEEEQAGSRESDCKEQRPVFTEEPPRKYHSFQDESQPRNTPEEHSEEKQIIRSPEFKKFQSLPQQLSSQKEMNRMDSLELSRNNIEDFSSKRQAPQELERAPVSDAVPKTPSDKPQKPKYEVDSAEDSDEDIYVRNIISKYKKG